MWKYHGRRGSVSDITQKMAHFATGFSEKGVWDYSQRLRYPGSSSQAYE